MTKTRKLLMGAAAAAALIAPQATAWEDTEQAVVFVEQVQLGNVWADMQVHVGDHVDGDAHAGAAAVGNTAAGLLMGGDIDYDSIQTQNGHVGAWTGLEGGDVHGTASAATTAYGNASTGGTWMGNTFYRAEQVSNGDVTALTDVNLRNVDKVATSTTAIANVSTPSSEFGDNRAFSDQQSNGSVYAETDADLCCDNDSASFSTVAGGNAVTSSGLTSTVINGAVQVQSEGTTVHAVSDVYIKDASDVSAHATSAANSYTLHNEFGYATLGRDGSELFQGNGADVTAESYVTLDHWNGQAVSSSYGVGNSALIANVGSDTALFANQNNSGDVASVASLNGSSFSGGTGHVNSTAIGNAASAFLCNTCGDAVLSGSVTQTNSGSIYAGGSAHIGHAGNVYGSATAVGNSASFTSGGSD